MNSKKATIKQATGIAQNRDGRFPNRPGTDVAAGENGCPLA